MWGLKGLDFYLLEVGRRKYEFSDLKRQITDLAKRWNANQTIIEDTGLGLALFQEMHHTKTLVPILGSSELDKTARFLAQSARFESGQVIVPRNASWLGDWLGELLSFPTANTTTKWNPPAKR